MAKVYRKEFKQFVPVPVEACWDFFSSPKNLKIITPPNMGFEIISGGEGKMYPGQIICYTVKPLFGISMNWVTEITQVSELHHFIDEQRFGPYKFWHHSHFFKAVEGGTEMTDIVHFALPFGWIGRIGLPLVNKELRGIFSFREGKIRELFG